MTASPKTSPGPVQRTARGVLYALLFVIPFSPAAIEILFPLLLVCWIAGWLSGRRETDTVWGLAPAQAALVSLLLYIAICTWSVVWSTHPQLSLDGLIGKTFEYALFFLIVADVARDSEVARKGIEALLWASLLVCIYSIAQQVIGTFRLKHGDHEVHRHVLLYGRMVGPYKNPNDLATYLMVAASIALARMLGTPGRPRLPLAGLIVLQVGCLAWTQSRAGLIGFAAALLVLVGAYARSRRAWVIVGAALALSCAWMAAGGVVPAKLLSFLTDAGSMERQVMWSTAYRMIEAKPLTGLGLNTFMANYLHFVTGPDQGPSYAHNCFLQIAAETGLIGLAAFFWFLAALLGRALASIARDPENRPIVTGLLAALAAFLVQSAFDTNLYALRQAVLFWSLAGMMLGLSLSSRCRSTAT